LKALYERHIFINELALEFFLTTTSNLFNLDILTHDVRFWQIEISSTNMFQENLC